ncbi:hypothetical protein HK405_010228, partial [Cladochytrium tenue]
HYRRHRPFMLGQLLAIPFLPRAIAHDLPLLDLLELSHTCVAARAAVARYLVGPLILRPLLELAREALAMRCQTPDSGYRIDDDWWLPCAAVAIRGCIDLRHLFDLQYLDEEAVAALQSILPRLQPENCCGSNFGRLERLLMDAIVEFGGDADVSTAAALELVPDFHLIALWVESICSGWSGYKRTRCLILTGNEELALYWLKKHVAVLEKHYSVNVGAEGSNDEELGDDISDSNAAPNMAEALFALIPLPEPPLDGPSIFVSQEWINLWKQMVAGYFEHNGPHYAGTFSRHFDSDSVIVAAVDAMFEVIQEKAVDGSDFDQLSTVVERQLLLDVLLNYLSSLDDPLYFASLCDRDSRLVDGWSLKESQTEKLDNFSFTWTSEDFRVAFLHSVEKSNKSLVVLACLCLNRQELLRMNCLEAIVPILLNKMGIQVGVGKIIKQIADDLSDSQLLQLLDVGLSVSESLSWATSVDPDLLRVGLPALCMALSKRGLKRRVQPLVRSLEEHLLHEDWKGECDYNYKHKLRTCVLECKEDLVMPDISAAWHQYLDHCPYSYNDEHEVFSGPVVALIRDGRVSLRDVEDMLVETVEQAASQKSKSKSWTATRKPLKEILRFTRRLKCALGCHVDGTFSVLGRPLLALIVARVSDTSFPQLDIARLLSARSGLSLDAQSDACLRDLWVEAVVLGCSKSVCQTRGTKMRSFLGPLSASVVARLRRRLRMFVGMKGGSDRTEWFDDVAGQLLKNAGILE